jgi:hypothetical protein
MKRRLTNIALVHVLLAMALPLGCGAADECPTEGAFASPSSAPTAAAPDTSGARASLEAPSTHSPPAGDPCGPSESDLGNEAEKVAK